MLSLLQLYEAAVTTRPDSYGRAEFVPFNASLGYGHKLIFMAPELPDILRWDSRTFCVCSPTIVPDLLLFG